jgi:hypothetical protein
MVQMGSKRLRISALCLAVIVSSLLIAFLGGCGGGGSKASKMSIADVWAKAGDTEKTINSEHMEIAIYYENTTYGSGQARSLIIDINGKDFHLQNKLFGSVVSEDIQVGGKHYTKDMGKSTWSEVQGAPADTSTSNVASQFLQLPSIASSQQRVGTETLDQVETEHYRFSLSPEAAVNMFPPTPPADFSTTTGGDVDVWITSSDFNMVRYELIIRNVKITDQIGIGDIRFLVNVTNINQPIEITAPK